MMNIGLWPSNSLFEAQANLVDFTLEVARAAWSSRHPDRSPGMILELGSGWGGTRARFAAAFPESGYVGINLSSDQAEAARSRNAALDRTRYVVGAVEEETTFAAVGDFELACAIEAAFHFEARGALLTRIRKAGAVLCLAEILVEDGDAIRGNRLLEPALGHAWSLGQYNSELHAAGFEAVEIQTLPGEPFLGFADHLARLDRDTYRARGGRLGILAQLTEAFTRLADLAEHGQVGYSVIAAA